MPLKFFGRRKGHYNFRPNCDFYVITIQFLDGSSHQFTLHVDSTGQDCMNFIRQRVELQQNLYFGLRYLCLPNCFRWVDFRKSLKKQLLRNANEFKLYFSVMFYTSHPEFITNDSSRYHYFLQMRSDILSGRLVGTPEKLILCASYSLQAEFGDYDPERQTNEVMENFPLLPLNMTQSAQIYEGFVRQASRGHEQLRGVSHASAELAYIKEARNFDGYGEDCCAAGGRDEDAVEVSVGYCLSGIKVKRVQSPPIIYGWKEVKRISSKKCNLLVHCLELDPICFRMEDADTAGYAAFLLSAQMEFYKHYDMLISPADDRNDDLTKKANSICALNTDSPETSAASSARNVLDLSGPSSTTNHSSSSKIFSQSRMTNAENNRQLLSQQASSVSNNHNKADLMIQSNLNLNLNLNSTMRRLSLQSPVCESLSCFVGYNNGERYKAINKLLPAYQMAPDYATALKLPSPSRSHIDSATNSSISSPNSAHFYKVQPKENRQQCQQTFSYGNAMDAPNLNLNANHLGNVAVTAASSTNFGPDPCLNLNSSLQNNCNSNEIALKSAAPPPTVEFSPNLSEPGCKVRLYTRSSDPAVTGVADSSKIKTFKSVPNLNDEPITDVRNLPVEQQEQANFWRYMQICKLGSLVHSDQNDALLAENTTNSTAICQHESLLLFKEFEAVPIKRVTAGSSTALKPENQRYRNPNAHFLPYEDNRVCISATKSNIYGYINASFIEILLEHHFCRYIAAQSPANETAIDFWRMIWETEAEIIVALDRTETYCFNMENEEFSANNLVENRDFSRYRMNFGDLTLTLQNSVKNSNFVTSIFLLEQFYTNRRRLIYHLKYTPACFYSAAGPSGRENNAQYVNSFLEFLDEVNSIQRLVKQNEELQQRGANANDLNGSVVSISSPTAAEYLPPPNSKISRQKFQHHHGTSSTIHHQKQHSCCVIASSNVQSFYPLTVVHCSTGVDWTGVFLLTNWIIRSVERNETLNVPNALSILRQQRMNMVQHFEDYKFCYLCLFTYVKNLRLI